MGLFQKLKARQERYNTQQRILDAARKIGARCATNPAYSYRQNIERGMIAAEFAVAYVQGKNTSIPVERKVVNLIIQDRRDQKRYEAMLNEGWRLEMDPIKRAGLRGATYTFVRDINVDIAALDELRLQVSAA